jgi:MYXO-CTERM domain-containing protein
MLTNGGADSTWVAVAIVAGVAALAMWRLARRRQTRT